jgi:chromosome segregation ATPase
MMSGERNEKWQAIHKRIQEIKEIINDPDRVDEHPDLLELYALQDGLVEIKKEESVERDRIKADLEKARVELENAYVRRDELAEDIKNITEKRNLIRARIEQLRQQERKSLEAAVEDGGLIGDDPRAENI